MGGSFLIKRGEFWPIACHEVNYTALLKAKTRLSWHVFKPYRNYLMTLIEKNYGFKFKTVINVPWGHVFTYDTAHNFILKVNTIFETNKTILINKFYNLMCSGFSIQATSRNNFICVVVFQLSALNSDLIVFHEVKYTALLNGNIRLVKYFSSFTYTILFDILHASYREADVR